MAELGVGVCKNVLAFDSDSHIALTLVLFSRLDLTAEIFLLASEIKHIRHVVDHSLESGLLFACLNSGHNFVEYLPISN